MPQFDLQPNSENEDDNHRSILLSLLGDGFLKPPSHENETPASSLNDDSSSQFSQEEIKATLIAWLGISTYREALRFLEQHPELLNQRSKDLLEHMISDFQARASEIFRLESRTPEQMKEVVKHLSNHLQLLREAYTRGGTVAAIREAYIDARGGFVLELPTWLEALIEQPVQMEGNRVALLRDAIASLCHQADIAREIWAELNFFMGQVLNNSVGMNKLQVHVERIRCLEASLQIFTIDRYPHLYARSQYYLAFAFIERIEGERKTNLEKAIACFNHALQVFTVDDNLHLYTDIQQSLGVVYCERIEGERKTNLEKAIAYFNHALQVLAIDDNPRLYAGIQQNLGAAYSERIMGERRDNLEEAIVCYNRAMQVLSLDAFPKDYAGVQHNLGLVYKERIEGERRTNLEVALACFNQALQIYTLDALPHHYARTQQNLSDVYRQRIAGERKTNLEEAIACCMRALRVFTSDTFSEEYARTQAALGNVYTERIVGVKRNNLEEAIVCFASALQVFTLDAFPLEYAGTQYNLGRAYRDRIAGVRQVNLEESIACFNQALQVFTPNAFPEDYAVTQRELGITYRERIAGEQRANLEEAIACFNRTLQVCTPNAFPEHYARTQVSLGNTYRDRIAGERQTNLEEAIACFKRALQVITLDTYPENYATVQLNLGASYKERIAGARRPNLEEAIACYIRALRVFTLDTFPVDYASTQGNLGEAYRERIAGERRINLEEAIACHTRALQVFTLDAFPVDYARTQSNLGIAYSLRVIGEKSINLGEAITCFDRALQIYTLDAYPNNHRQTQLNRALTAAQQEDWSSVHDTYRGAMAAEDILLTLGTGVIGRDAILKESHDAAMRDGFALIRLSRITEAAAAIERGRARGLAEAIAINDADSSLIRDPERRTHYENMREKLIAAQAALNAPYVLDLDPEMLPADPTKRVAIIDQERHTLEQVRTATYFQAKKEFESTVANIRKAQDPAHFLETSIDPKMILRAAEFGGNKHALVYLLATSWGGLAVTAFSSNPSTQSVAHFAALDLPDLTEGLLAELVESKLESGTQLMVIGGFSWAQGDNGFYRLLANDRLSYLEGASFREFAALLHTICGENAKTSALDIAAQRTLSIPELAATIDQPLNQLIYKQGEFQILVNTLEHFFLQYELKKCMNVLNDVVFRPLTEWLCRESVESVTLIPCGWLAAFPLTAAEIAPGQTMSDLFATSVAPNARSLSYNEYATGKRSGIYALGDPRPSFQELRWGEAEAYALSNLARDLRLPTEVKVQHKATRDWLIHALQKGYIVNASCHGVFDIHAPLQSALLVAQGENLTLGAILSNEADLRGLRLLILSACQTALLDLRGARDEVRSLAAGMLQAGARAVLASLWSVDDKATYLLMVRFAQEWFPRIGSEPPAAALARAQCWLRTITNRDLQSWRANHLPMSTIEEKRRAGSEKPEQDPWTEEEQELVGSMKLATVRGRGNRFDEIDAESIVRLGARRQNDPDVCPYEDPIYWAGFQITGW